MSQKYLRGAFIEFTETFPLPIPNVILFQFNPETMTHTWTPATAGAGAGAAVGTSANPLAVTDAPTEAFSFSLTLDSNDMIADGGPVGEAFGTVSGVYTRLAALEMLLYPTAPSGGGLIGSISSALGAGGPPAPQTAVPASQLPTVLFVWGPGRILPVRVNSLTVTETLYDSILLNPTHVTAAIGLKVLTDKELAYVDGPLGFLAKGAYDYSHTLRKALAVANLANGVGDIIGMLPV